jgi:hypothetical protein
MIAPAAAPPPIVATFSLVDMLPPNLDLSRYRDCALAGATATNIITRPNATAHILLLILPILNDLPFCSYLAVCGPPRL